MRLQIGLFSLFLLALVLASYVDASAKKKKKKKKGKKKKVSILSDKSTRRDGAITLPSSPALKSKSESKPTSLLVDTVNTAPAVQPKDQGILVQSVPDESQVSERDEQTKRFEELINNKQYEEMVKLGKDMSDEEPLKCLCQAVTDLDHFKGLYEHLRQRDMVPAFLAHGGMVVVREAIVETDLLEIRGLGQCDSIYDAIALSLKQDRHDRVAGLFEAAYEKPAWKNNFGWFVRGFFERYPPVKNSMPLKRFLTIHGEELNKKHPAVFTTICERLVGKLSCRLDSLASQKLLIDLVGQPSLITPVAFAEGFLYCADDDVRANFINYGYKGTIEEGFKGDYGGGGIYLWAAMVKQFPDQFSGEYPRTGEARTVALKDFKPTKQDREEEWIVNNASNPQTKLRMRQLAEFIDKLGINVPTVLWVIVVEYATVPTWLDTE